jgi:outer membrane protein assembly factor BamB
MNRILPGRLFNASASTRLSSGVRSLFVLIFHLMLMLAMPVRGEFVPSQDGLAPERSIDMISADLQAGRVVEAVDRVQTLLAQPRPQFVRVDERQLSIQTWIRELRVDEAVRNRFEQAYDKALGETANRAITTAERSGSVAGVMRAASLYPWTDAARKAPAIAAKVALSQGDVTTAQILSDRTSTMPEIDKLPRESTLSPVLFSADWYVDFFPAFLPRTVPVGSKDLVVVASPGSTTAMSANGRTLWTTGAPIPPKTLADARGTKMQVPIDTSFSRPLVWCDISGTPRVVVVRATDSEGSSLRAYRVTDGALLWDTRTDESTRDWMAMGAPVSAGGYVYFAAGRFDTASGVHAIIAAAEIGSGKIVWSSDVGELATAVKGQVRVRDGQIDGRMRALMQVSEIASEVTIDDNNVYLVTGGWCIAVDRYSGAARWMASYVRKEYDKRTLDREKTRKPPSYKRWRDAAYSDGQIVVIAPTDSAAAVAYESATGRVVWKHDDRMVKDELIGVADGKAFFVGASLTAVGIDTGTNIWQNAIASGSMSGPAFLDGGNIVAMSNRGPIFFETDRGQLTQVPPKEQTLVNFDAFLKQPAARTSLQQTGILDYFQK